MLIGYATGEGQTHKIARFIGDSIERQGIKVDYMDANEPLPQDFSCQNYQGVILGSSLRYRRFAESLREFIRQNKVDIERVPSAFYSVSLGDVKRLRAGVTWFINSFLLELEWQPKLIGRFGGALRYTQFKSKWEKGGMLFGAAIMGLPTDTSRDHEFTDWSQVAEFADNFVAMMKNEYSVKFQGSDSMK